MVRFSSRALAGLLVLSFIVSAGQFPEGSVAGSVIDPSGAVVTGAPIVARTAQGSVVQATVTDLRGTFVLGGLKTGSYLIEISAEGFEKQYSAVTVFGNAKLEIPAIRLQLARSATSVTVSGLRNGVETVEESVQLITGRERSEIRGRTLPTIGSMLSDVPGVMLQQTTYGASSPHLRGLTGYQTLLLLDGIRFNTSIFRSGPNQYLALIDPAGVGRVEAAMGPSGAAFGSDSMGGTINVIAEDAPGVAGGSGVHGEAGLQGASADWSGGAFARFGGAVGGFSWSAGGAAHQFNDLRAGGGRDSRNAYARFFGLSGDQIGELYGNRLQDTGFSRNSVDARLGYQVAGGQTLSAYYQRTDLRNVRSYRDQFGGIGRIQALFTPQTLNFGYVRYEKLNLGFLDSLSGTFSVNNQDDGFIQQNPRITDPVVTDDSVVRAKGYAVQAATHIGSRNAVVFGGEVYDESVGSFRFSLNPVNSITEQQRALYPNGSRYINSGLFIQESLDLVNGRLRLSGGLRFTDVRYSTRSERNFTGSGVSLGVPDSTQVFRDLTFNSSARWQVAKIFSIVGLVGRGFRAPNVNDAGAVGLRTLAYDVTSDDARAAGALFGADGGDGSSSTGRKVGRLGAEELYNYEVGFRVSTSRFHARVHGYDAELINPIQARTLLFPVGSVPGTIGGFPVSPLPPSPIQQQQGVVAVATPFGPRAVKTMVNMGRSRYMGVESLASYRFDSRWRAEWHYSFLSGRDLDPVRPIRRLPPQSGGMRIWYTPSGRRPWLMVATRFTGAQARLNGSDIDDDRIGASRRRSDVASFFRGAVVSPFIGAGNDGRPNTADDVFAPTGETLLQIQDRVLPLGSTINGVTISGDGTRVPLFTQTDGWWTVDLQGGYPVAERISMFFGWQNLLDRNYRIHGSGTDSPGSSIFAGIRYAF